MPVYFYSQEISFQLSNEQSTNEWLLKVINAESPRKAVELNIIFMSDDDLLEMNKSFLNHDYYTDIITFPIEDTDELLEAELYISVDRVKENAKKLSTLFELELNRVMVHGVLHLSGFGDKSEEEIEVMRAKENEWLLKI